MQNSKLKLKMEKNESLLGFLQKKKEKLSSSRNKSVMLN